MCARVLYGYVMPRSYTSQSYQRNFCRDCMSDCSVVAHSRTRGRSETSLLANGSGESVSFETRNPPRTNYDTTEIFGVTCTGISPQKFLRTPTWIPPTTSKTFDRQARLALNSHFVFNRDFHQRGGCAVSLEKNIRPFIIGFLDLRRFSGSISRLTLIVLSPVFSWI